MRHIATSIRHLPSLTLHTVATRRSRVLHTDTARRCTRNIRTSSEPRVGSSHSTVNLRNLQVFASRWISQDRHWTSMTRRKYSPWKTMPLLLSQTSGPTYGSLLAAHGTQRLICHQRTVTIHLETIYSWPSSTDVAACQCYPTISAIDQRTIQLTSGDDHHE